MAVNQEASTSGGNICNIHYNASITFNQLLAGSGSNIKNQNAISTPETIEAQDRQLQLECKEIKSNSREKAEQNCLIDQMKFVAESNFAMNYVPLQLVQVNHVTDIKKTRNAKKEISEILTEQPNEYLQLETFFETSRKFAESSDIYKNLTANRNATKEMKESLLNKLSNVVFVVGHAGIGKTCLTKKYLQLVLKNKVDDGFLFYIKFRDVDYENKISLMTFLTGNDRYERFDEQRLQNILEEISNNDNVTLVLDGMDESKIEIDKISKSDTNPYKKAKAQDFILGLLNGSILCKSKKLFASRPKQLFDLPKQYQPLFIIKLLGIDQTSQKLICKNICGDDFDVVYKLIQSNSDLSNYCCIPLICIIIVYCFYINFKEKQYIPCSLSEIFVILICMYINDPTHLRGKLPLKGLCELAFSGISNQKLYFNFDDLKLFSLDKEDQNNFTVTFQCYYCTDKITFLTNATLQYTYFSHLIVQEWFAALYLMLYAETKEFETVLFSGINLHSTNFDVFVKFLFGLSNESMFKKYFHNLPHKINLKSFSQKVNLLKKYVKSIIYPISAQNSVHCWLHELKDQELTQQVADKLDNEFSVDNYFNKFEKELLPNNIPAIFYVLRCRRKKINLNVWETLQPNLLEKLGTILRQNINIKLKYLSLPLNNKNISASIFLLQKVEELTVGRFASFQVALKFSDAVLLREQPLKRLMVHLEDESISAICSCLKNIEGLKSGVYFLSFQAALKFRDAVMQLEHPMKMLECYGCSDDVKQCLLPCQENVEELIINDETIKKLIRNNKEQESRSCLTM